MGDHPFPPIIETMRKAASALREAEVPFVLGGSLAAWARGGPETTKDLDLLVRPEHADAALEALAAVGMRPERPPEDWLHKAWDGDVLVDVIFRLTTGPIGNEVFDRAEELNVASVTMPVMSLEDMMVARLLALDDHHLDLAPLLLIARALREQVDWSDVRERTRESAYARGFLAMLEGLEVIDGDPGGGGAEVSVQRDDTVPTTSGAFGPTPIDVR